jgi:catechol 2,3-dioxygenase-like lactoylglutathione lyase family enzyme
MALTYSADSGTREHTLYDVGGVLLERPFKVRRLGHFGFNVTRIAEGIHFYVDLLGFTISDEIDFGARLTPEQTAGLSSTRGVFTRHGADHHSFVLFPREPLERMGMGGGEVTINQITWQVGSLKEVGDAVDYFQREGFKVGRIGRDTPGSNWHVYPADPDGHTNELYYGIEQIGWDGYSKPRAMYTRGFRERPPLPQISEFDEVQQALADGVDLHSGYRYVDASPRTYDVDGILLARPFKIVKIGPVRLFVQDLDRSLDYYTRGLGFALTHEVEFEGQRCVFLRANTEHHSLALYPLALRERLGLSPHTTCLSFGVQLANYRQLRDAVAFLREHGVTVRALPAELSPGIDYSAFAIDPDGHAIQLYYYMQQSGDASLSVPATVGVDEWPLTVQARPDTFAGEAYLGPWG